LHRTSLFGRAAWDWAMRHAVRKRAMIGDLAAFRGVNRYEDDAKLRVGVEAPAALAAEPAGGDVLPEQRARRVLGVAESLVQDLHDRDARVEADQVGERERPHRMREAEPRDRV